MMTTVMVADLLDEADLCRNDGATDIADLLDAAAKTVTALEADAARYHWLRVRHAPHRHEVNFWTGQSWDVLEGEKLDASIDAALDGPNGTKLSEGER